MSDFLWQAKLHARLHDPAEKALVLLRDPAGHEGGTSRVLHQLLFPEGVDKSVQQAVRRADWWASAADRPQFPRQQSDGRYAAWTQVNFAKEPVLIHPLTGDELDLRHSGGLRETDVEAVKQQSFSHTERLLSAVGGPEDWRKAALVLWRFGPELDASGDRQRLGELWRFLPADTRVPDHSIWDHLDLVAAFAGAFVADAQGECALLNLSIGPVQEFIAAARTTSDLWAGSHLLSRLSWEAMRVVCERLGPEAVLFPRLRGVPLVDLWLIQECGLPRELFENQDWARSETDANPLFSAALPNRFLAVVPADRAVELAKEIEAHLQAWVLKQADAALRRILREAGGEDRDDLPAYQQIRAQLQGFPEVHWSVTPYSGLVAEGEREVRTDALAEAMQPFFPAERAGAPGFLGSEAWSILQRPVELEGSVKFYQPNPGTLYPALHELGERVLAAAKAVRPFQALAQQGYRCSLTAEAEWLTEDRQQLELSPGQRGQAATLWSRLAKKQPGWVRKGEHLGALAALKRLWPTLFVEELQAALNKPFSRFVVSTHTMALATSLSKLAEKDLDLDEALRQKIQRAERVALPRKLVQRLRKNQDFDLLARLPGWLDAAREEGDEALEEAKRELGGWLGTKPEAYYALLSMDGDRMGAWLSGDKGFAIPYGASFHPAIRAGMQERFSAHQALNAYLQAPRAVSPARHMAISGALNDFSSVIAREVAEREYMGRILYAGGDDLLAMFTASDLLPAMRRLRLAYSGQPPQEGEDPAGMQFRRGFVYRKGRLHLTMGRKATASAGAVIAHHQAPLSAVLRALREAEQRAKGFGRDAFSLVIVKRAGGALTLTQPWERKAEQPDMVLALQQLAAAFHKDTGASRRAAYNVHGWLVDLPEPEMVGGEAAFRQMLEDMLSHQFERQGLKQPEHAERLARLCPAASAADAADFIENFLSVAEFLGRETRSAS